MKKYKVHRLSMVHGTYQIGSIVYQPSTNAVFKVDTRPSRQLPYVIVEADNERDAINKAHQKFCDGEYCFLQGKIR